MRIVLGTILLFSVSPCAVPASVFNFDSDIIGTPAPFVDTVNGVSATFSSNGPLGEFAVAPSFFITLSGNVLLSPGILAPPNTAPLDLTASFSSMLDGITLKFALNASDPAPFTLTAFLDSTQVATLTVGSSIPGALPFPEGSLTFSGTAFNRVVFSTTALNFAVDDITVTPANSSAPEPAAVSLLVIGSSVLAFRFRHRFFSQG
jgi:hypothetical protein